jgi:hypothetical protein
MRWLLFLATLMAPCQARAQSPEEHLRMCTASGMQGQFCEASRDQFVQEMPKALRGDYQSQRNVAYCLSTGCDGAVKVNAALSCAWRVVIQASGSSKVDATDAMAFKNACGALDDLELATASEQAQALFKKIYRRSLPARFR